MKKSSLDLGAKVIEQNLTEFLKELEQSPEYCTISVTGDRHATVNENYKILTQTSSMVQDILKRTKNYEHILLESWLSQVEKIRDYFTTVSLSKVPKEHKADEIAFQADLQVRYKKLVDIAEAVRQDPEAIDNRKVLGDANLSLVDLRII